MGEKKITPWLQNTQQIKSKEKLGFYFQPDLTNNKKQVKNQTQYTKK